MGGIAEGGNSGRGQALRTIHDSRALGLCERGLWGSGRAVVVPADDVARIPTVVVPGRF